MSFSARKIHFFVNNGNLTPCSVRLRTDVKAHWRHRYTIRGRGMLSSDRQLLCACADREQHTSLLYLNHFYLKNSESKIMSYPATLDMVCFWSYYGSDLEGTVQELFFPKSFIFGGFEKKSFQKWLEPKTYCVCYPNTFLYMVLDHRYAKKCHNFGQKL